MADEKTQRKRRFMPLVRTVHIYLSLLALVAILAFGATGLVMNHKDQLKLEEPTVVKREAQFNRALLEKEIEEDAVVAELCRAHGFCGKNDRMEKDNDKIRFSFRQLARLDEVEISVPDGKMTITTSTWGVLGELGCLHTGRDAHPWWQWAIDAVAVSLLLVSLTGVVLWFSLPSRRKIGAVMLLVGAGLCVAAYLAIRP